MSNWTTSVPTPRRWWQAGVIWEKSQDNLLSRREEGRVSSRKGLSTVKNVTKSIMLTEHIHNKYLLNKWMDWKGRKPLGWRIDFPQSEWPGLLKRISTLNFTLPLQKHISSSTSHPVHHTDILPCFPSSSFPVSATQPTHLWCQKRQEAPTRVSTSLTTLPVAPLT